jgi:hypothetical protein
MIKAFVCVALVALAAPLNAQMAVDTTGAAAIVRQATEHSEVMKNLEYLGDVIGPRLTGSAAMRRANDWTGERFKAYGLSTAIEPWDFGVTWERGPVFARLLAPFQRGVTAHSWAWTAGTAGKPLAGPVVLVNVSAPESVAVYRDRTKGAWLITGQPATILNPDGPPMTASDSAALRARLNAFRAPQDTSAAAVARRRQFQTDLPYMLKQAGALGRLTDGDHLSFIPYGVPGWNFDQESRGYNHTHHSQVDTYDHAIASDLVQASAVMAATAFELANLPSLLPRGVKTPVVPRTIGRPSAGLATK